MNNTFKTINFSAPSGYVKLPKPIMRRLESVYEFYNGRGEFKNLTLVMRDGKGGKNFGFKLAHKIEDIVHKQRAIIFSKLKKGKAPWTISMGKYYLPNLKPIDETLPSGHKIRSFVTMTEAPKQEEPVDRYTLTTEELEKLDRREYFEDEYFNNGYNVIEANKAQNEEFEQRFRNTMVSDRESRYGYGDVSEERLIELEDDLNNLENMSYSDLWNLKDKYEAFYKATEITYSGTQYIWTGPYIKFSNENVYNKIDMVMVAAREKEEEEARIREEARIAKMKAEAEARRIQMEKEHQERLERMASHDYFSRLLEVKKVRVKREKRKAIIEKKRIAAEKKAAKLAEIAEREERKRQREERDNKARAEMTEDDINKLFEEFGELSSKFSGRGKKRFKGIKFPFKPKDGEEIITKSGVVLKYMLTFNEWFTLGEYQAMEPLKFFKEDWYDTTRKQGDALIVGLNMNQKSETFKEERDKFITEHRIKLKAEGFHLVLARKWGIEDRMHLVKISDKFIGKRKNSKKEDKKGDK